MKHFVTPRLFIALFTALTGIGSLLISHTAAADYRVTAFGESTAYKALLSKDVESAKEIFGGRAPAKLDFVELNNLCVTQILDKALDSAIASCSMALEKVDFDMAISHYTAKSAKASILSNMAVAKAMSGDLSGAGSDIERALILNGRDRNANSNYSLISGKTTPAGIAQSI